jgi:glycosyltransferase involved in cell wall biosynthesis
LFGLTKSSAMKISVALCTFNGEPFLLDQLNSIEQQSRPPDELVVCDDRSEDGTAAVVDRFARRVGFKISFSVNMHRLGVTENFGRALSLCSGDVIVPCDQDDVWEPDKLAALEACFLNDPELLLAFSDLAIISPEGKLSDRTQWQRLQFGPSLQADVNEGRAFELLLRFNVITGAAMAFRSSLRDRVLPIPDGFVHDEWIGLVAAATGRVLCIDRPLVRYRQHARQAIGPAVAHMLAQYRHARANMGRPYFEQMVERTRSLHERLSSHGDALLHQDSLSMIEEKLLHALTRLRMRDDVLIRWPLAIGEAVRGRYSRYGYGLKSFLQDLVL